MDELREWLSSLGGVVAFVVFGVSCWPLVLGQGDKAWNWILEIIWLIFLAIVIRLIIRRRRSR